jgi:DNA repair exonuclease SbcCD ATPase subunit
MNKFTLKKLELEAFRSFEAKQSVELASNGLYLIKGNNLNTGSASASGKTNFHLGISWLLGYCPVDTVDLQNWNVDTKLSGLLELDTPDGLVIIKRGRDNYFKSPKLEVTGAKAVNEAIKSLFQIPIELVDALTLRKQKSAGRFLSMTDKEKKEFLSKLLNLEEIEPIIEASNKKANEAWKQAEQTKIVLDVHTNNLKLPTPPVFGSIEQFNQELDLENENLLSVLKELQTTNEVIKTYNSKIEEVKQSIFRTSTTDISSPQIIEITNQLSQCNNLISKRENEIEAQRAVCKTEMKQLEIALAAAQREAAKLPLFEQNLKNVEEKILGLKNSKCPTCKQDWLAAESLLANLLTDKTVAEVGIKAAQSAQNDIPKLSVQSTEWFNKFHSKDDVLTKLIEAKAQLTAKLAEAKANLLAEDYKKHNEFNKDKFAKISELEAALSPFLGASRDLGIKIKHIEGVINLIKNNIQLTERSNKSEKQRSELEFLEYERKKEEIFKLKSVYDGHMATFSLESDIAAALKGFLGSIFEEVLAEISVETNNLLKQIPNVASTTIQFVTETLTQKETVRQEIKPLIYKNGTLVKLKSGVSGGQETAIELAVDLAIGTVIGRRTGILPGWLILDEVFTGLGVVEKENCLELLKKVSSDRLILVVDHMSEVKEYFDRFIEIECYNDVSVIKGIN